ncbi:carbon-monoxide dehydrogenase large subunit [Methylobacterium sp. PvP062]|uniref:Carbon-monoxide dehydrogenase large subunit n=1 Tax=Methylobacterium radiotolerans TaxID=31998 RepID=A0ABV2NTZ2_9HYPH|nr:MULTISPECIES: xanthine dehydrogenase family protein molybdopterin-binding subunit [unclassified Methylobacterium]MBP2498288.1 carbon-monoxide dehydrogenase large subunit [Methylobacterium sp. PvP105]MBP2505672.1 carbon-monoxide dehydrogenase large subunit [Methylobacterium sp. PvP109]
MALEAKQGEGIGARVERKEDSRFMRGRGRYVGDIAIPGMRDVAFLRSPLAHGRILSVTKPAGNEGAVFVAEDLNGVVAPECRLAIPGFKLSAFPPLAKGKVRFVGEPVAMCVGATRALAEDLAEEVELDLEELPAVVDSVAARDGSPVLVHEHWNDNVFVSTHIDTGIAEAARAATVKVSGKFKAARQVMNPMEGRAVLAYWDDRANQLVVYASTQVPHLIRLGISEFLGLEQEFIRVVAPDVGGGFGLKCNLESEQLLIAWLAMTYKKPFRWIEDRREHLIAGANCRDHHYEVTAYADGRGMLLGVDVEVHVDAGAYSVWPSTSALEGTMAGNHFPGPYKFSAYRAQTYSVATNKPPVLPYRGVARTNICFAMELTLDAIARKIGREPWEVRLQNLVSAAAMPFTNPTGRVYDSGDYGKSLQMAVEQLDVPAIRAQQASNSKSNKRIGVGFANYIEMTGHGTAAFVAGGYAFIPGYEQATVRFTPDGGLEIRAGVHSHGQGMETSLAQIAHEVLHVPLARIAVVLGDTALTPYSTGTYASRSITMAGGAVARACAKLKERMTKIAAHLLQAAPVDVTLVGDRFQGPVGDIAMREVAVTWYRQPQRLPEDVDPGGIEVTEGFKAKADTGQFAYGSHGALVEVDLDLGEVKILDYVVVEDCGRIVNPLIVEGQAYGGTAQGIGTALFEEMTFDQNGQPLASTLADYMLPGASEMPQIKLMHIETPSPLTEFGIKGAGESGAIPPPAAILNAVNDAIKEFGVVMNELPLTPRRLLTRLAEARAAGNDPHLTAPADVPTQTKEFA